uniref:Uncharacterized protein n=1 Tax=Rhizophora mucronata TaxID=61149 RepID=A0A2P2PTX3_RHIMU
MHVIEVYFKFVSPGIDLQIYEYELTFYSLEHQNRK